MLRYLLFDLDATLYTPSTGLWATIGERISLYMIERLRLPAADVPALREHYFGQYGTTLNGLIRDYGVDPIDYLNFVHDLPLEQYLQPDIALNAMLARLPLPKIIFTNSDEPHARRVLTRLGILRHFKQIIDIHSLGLVNKPDPGAYARALELLGAPAAECLFADDSLRNLRPAHDLGMITVLVGEPEGPAALAGVDYHIPTILGLERIVAALIGQAW